MRMEPGQSFPSVGAARIDCPSPVPPTQWVQEQMADDGPHFMQLVGILRSRRKMILTVAAVGAVLAGIIGLLLSPKYTATAQIVVEPEQAAPIGGPELVSRPTDQAAIDTHVTMLTSRAHLRRVLDGLTDHAEFPASAAGISSSERNVASLPHDPSPRPPALDTAIGPSQKMNAMPSFAELGRRAEIWLGAMSGREPGASQELDELDRGLKVMQERASRVISVSFTAKGPETAAAVANRVVELYVDGQTEQKLAQADEELAALGVRAAKLKSRLEEARGAMQTLLLSQVPAVSGTGNGEKEAGLPEIQREAASIGEAYAGLLRRQKDIRDRQETITPGVRVLSLASPPERPSSANPLLFIFPALIVSLIGASLLAIVLERVDRGLRSERDVVGALGLPCIGLVPQLRRSQARRPLQYLLHKPFTPYTEAIRSAAVTLHLVAGPSAPTTILISSSVPGEGKTTIAVSLGVYAALLGKRVLLIDFDSRHPSVLRTLRGQSETPVLDLKESQPEEFIQHLSDLNLDYLPMPRHQADPLAPFIERYLQRFLLKLRGSYDCIVIDSPPVLGITETRLLAALVDKVLFVIKWKSTRREIADNAVNVLRDALRSHKDSTVQVSALVTRVDLKKHADYHYGDVGEAFVKHRKYYRGSSKA